MALFSIAGDNASPAPQRSGVMLALAVLIPVIIFMVVQAVVIVNDRRTSVESAALARAQAIIDRTDAEVLSDLRALAAVGQSIRGVAITRRTPDRERASYSAALFPEWTGVLVWSLVDRIALYSSFPGEDIPVIPHEWLADRSGVAGPVADGVARVTDVPVAVLHVVIPEDERQLVLTLGVNPRSYQAILMSELPEGAIGAVVDREGLFLARSLDIESRVATPATEYVRAAVAKGGSGFYRGRTFEGFENYTAYVTSPVTGWSSHVAISSALVDQPQSLSLVVALVGGAICLLVTGGLVFLLIEDSRRRRRTEALVQQSQKMETIGQLTGGVAHDFNNLLTVIIGSLDKLKRTGDSLSAEARASAIEDALDSSRRAAGLTRSLLAYSRQQALDPTVIEVNDFLQDTRELIARSIGEKYVVRCDLDPAAGRIEIDDSQLASAVLNLAVNSRDAMPDGGHITISSKAVSLEKRDRENDIAAGKYVRISVRDDGPGMSEALAERAFEPFFTTKEVGKGTGLGLAQVDGFVRQSGGAIRIETSPGEGLCVHLYMPATHRPVARPDKDRAIVAHPPMRPLRILLVEDEAAVQGFAADLLRESGHQVTVCANVEEARAQLAETQFDLLFSDIVLPGKTDGAEFAREAVRSQPDLRVLLATGYAGDRIKYTGDRFPILWKPYDAADLHAAIDQLFNASSGTPGRVLLVEDEALISMLAVDTLGEAGFEVIESPSAAHALDVFAGNPESFAVAIVDLGLPDRSGTELIQDLRKLRPDLPVLVASGKGPPTASDLGEAGAVGHLNKPYTPEELVASVRTFLGEN